MSSVLQAAGTDTSEKMAAAQGSITDGLNKAGKQLVEQLGAVQMSLSSSLQGAGKEAADQLASSASVYSDKMESAGQALQAQMEAISSTQKNIEKLLHVEQAVETTLKSVSASEEFKNMLSALRTHLAESDKLIKEATKPKMITLVESD